MFSFKFYKIFKNISLQNTFLIEHPRNTTSDFYLTNDSLLKLGKTRGTFRTVAFCENS